jgi:hypothetical protein
MFSRPFYTQMHHDGPLNVGEADFNRFPKLQLGFHFGIITNSWKCQRIYVCMCAADTQHNQQQQQAPVVLLLQKKCVQNSSGGNMFGILVFGARKIRYVLLFIFPPNPNRTSAQCIVGTYCSVTSNIPVD